MQADLLNLRDEVVNLKVCSCQCPHPSGEVVSAAQPVEEYIMQQKPSDGGPASVKGVACTEQSGCSTTFSSSDVGLIQTSIASTTVNGNGNGNGGGEPVSCQVIVGTSHRQLLILCQPKRCLCLVHFPRSHTTSDDRQLRVQIFVPSL